MATWILNALVAVIAFVQDFLAGPDPYPCLDGTQLGSKIRPTSSVTVLKHYNLVEGFPNVNNPWARISPRSRALGHQLGSFLKDLKMFFCAFRFKSGPPHSTMPCFLNLKLLRTVGWGRYFFPSFPEGFWASSANLPTPFLSSVH